MWGPRPEARRQSRQPRLKACTPHRSGATLAFLSIELASGMIVNRLRLMTGPSGPWIAMPSQKQLDGDGNPRLDASGKPLFNQIIEFRDRATTDRFTVMVIELVRARYPEVLEGRP
jgi:hypothetical protein